MPNLSNFINKLNEINRSDLANLELTYRCNMRCKTCGLVKSAENRKEPELLTDEWFSIIDQLVKIGKKKFMIIGAEPLIRKDLVDIILYIKKKGCFCAITTNAFLLTSDLSKRLIDAKLDEILISVDAPDELHNEIRQGKNLFLKVKEGIAWINKEKKNANSIVPSVKMHTTVSDLNKHVISEMVSVAKDFGTNSLRFQYLSETPPAAVNSTMFNGTCIGSDRFIPNDVSFLLKKEGIKVFRDQIKKITETKSTDELKISSKYLSNLSDERIISGCFPVKQCTIVKRRILINPWGEVFPCAHLNYIFGSLKNNSLEEILVSKTYTSLVEFLENNLFPVCNFCCNYPHNLTQLQLLKLGSGLKN